MSVLSLVLSIALAKQPGTIAFKNVSVIDVVGGKVLPRQNVVVVGDKISQVGTAAVPAGATLVDGTGKFLIPGLWDMHVHGSGISAMLPLYVANGVTGVRDMYTDMAEIRSSRTKIAAGTIAGPEIVAAGRLIDGPKPIWEGSLTAKDADEGRQAVRTALSEGSDFIKVYSLLPREAYFAIAEEAKKRGKDFCGHVPNSIDLLEAARAGQKSDEHLTGFLAACSTKRALASQTPMERLRAYVESFDDKRAREVIGKLAKTKMWQCPTLVVLHNVAFLDSPEFEKDSRLPLMPPYFKSMWNPANDFRFKERTSEDWAVSRRAYELDLRIVGMLARKGANILAGTDTLNPYVFPGFSLHEELAYLVQAGLTSGEALRAATVSPAKYLGRTNEIGQVRSGFRADLVLLDANPLMDIRNTTKIRAVVVRGELLLRDRLDATLRPQVGAKRTSEYESLNMLRMRQAWDCHS